MEPSRLPQTKDLVLIGGGHTHALVLRKWGMAPLAGARVTLINPGPTAPYSGMLPGHIAGHYRREELDIDLVRLARFAGARLIIGAADGIDLITRTVHVPGRPPVGFDVCSVDIGVTSDMPDLPGFREHAVPAKPLGPFAATWARYLDGTGPASVAVIGGGVAGAEIAMAMAHALTAAGREHKVHLIERDKPLASLGDTARKKLLRALTNSGVDLIEAVEIAGIHADHVALIDGRRIDADFVTGAAGARPHDWVAKSGLDQTEGFITVNDHLQSSDPQVFAAGDCAHLEFDPRPKAGVFAVRQAPVLHDNLCASLAGGPMRRFRPQRDYLKLISLGGKSALTERFGATPSGAMMWRLKDRIDRAFMDRFHDLTAMPEPDLPAVHTTDLETTLGDRPLCGGCGAKVGRGALRGALNALPASDRDDILPLPGDDAALLVTGGQRQVMSTDHLRAVTPDPVLMARIAAVHALGDIWAMGATPQAATATLILPRLSHDLQERTLAEILQDAATVLGDAGAEIVGGHSSVGDEMTIGFTITGLLSGDPITLSGGQAGDALILTKPLGSGVIMAAEMAQEADGATVCAAWQQMTRPQGDAAAVLAGARAMTDVTGFGLAGHLKGICEASGTGAELDLDAVTVMEGALALASAGVRSSLFADNRTQVPELPEGGKADLLFDPQTAGGLLAAVPADQATVLVRNLRQLGHDAAAIGYLTEGPPLVSLAAS